LNIFVARLNYSTEEDSLRYLFEGFGSVDSVKIIFDRETGRSKGFGFVEMPNDEEAQDAINALNDTDFEERTIVVKKARPRKDNRNNRGGGGYNSNRNNYGGGY